jgi:membrane-associated protease RseP (regulator of RpoE activity)
VNTDEPVFPPLPASAAPEPIAPAPLWVFAPPRPKFQDRYRRHLLLFALTLLTTTYAGAWNYEGFRQTIGIVEPFTWYSLDFISRGLWYSVPVLMILSAHEFGHYVLCRVHDVDASLPFFIPAPFVMTGTLGAVIRIREAFPTRKALFDIGIAGPIGGFLVLVPFLAWGVMMSKTFPVDIHGEGIAFGEPLLIKALLRLRFGVLPAGYDVTLHPMGFAAWWGMLATSLNLMPFGQLDGGHIAHAVLGRRAWWVSAFTLITAALLTALSTSWIAVTVMMLAMAFVMGLHHPRAMDEQTPLDNRRRLIAVFALVMFMLCFTPVPINVFFGK